MTAKEWHDSLGGININDCPLRILTVEKVQEILDDGARQEKERCRVFMETHFADPVSDQPQTEK